MAKKTRVVKCDEEFVNLIEETKEKFEEKTGIDISSTQATKIICNNMKNINKINNISKINNINTEDEEIKDVKITEKLNNLYYIEEEIEIEEKIDAEHYASGYFRDKGYKVFFTKTKDLFMNQLYFLDNPDLNKLKNIFQDKKREYRNGRPDLIIIKGNDVKFVEVKTNTDSLRADQLNWIRTNPEFEVTIFYLNQTPQNG